MTLRQRLWLHVGPAKTGPKSIQSSLHKGRAKLKWHGVCYPKPKGSSTHGQAKFNHHSLAKALRAEDLAYVSENIDELPDAPDTVLSSEGFSKCSVADLDALRAILAPRFEVVAVFYARHPVDVANSQGQQYIKSGKRTFDELAQTRPRMSLKKNISRLRQVFGADGVKVRKFHRSAFVNGCLINDFLFTIGRPTLVRHVPVVRQNEGMSLETALAIDAHRKATGDLSVITGNDLRFRSGSTRFTLPDGTVATILERARDDIDWLRETFGIDLDADRDGMAPRPAT